MWYNIISTGISYQQNDRLAWVTLEKSTFPFFWRKPQKMLHKVYFDLYDLKITHKIYDGFCTIEKDWIELKARERKTIMDLLQKHFKSDYVVGNFRNTLKKV